MSKNLLKLVAIALLTFTMGGCNDDSDCTFESTTLKVEQTALTVSSEKGTETVKVETNSDYTATVDANWLTVSKQSGNLLLNFAENTSDKERTAKITVVTTNNAKKATITVLQKKAKSILLEKTEFETPAKGEEYTVKITTDETYTVKPMVDWIVILENTDKTIVKFKVLPNPDKTPRMGTISFLIGDKSYNTITVNQEAKKDNFIMPFLGWGQQDLEIEKFEQGRTNETKFLERKKKDASGTSGDSFTLLKYEVLNDDFFGKLSYVANLKGYQKATLYPKDKNVTDEQKKLFENFLLENGYEKIIEKGFKSLIDWQKIDKEKFVNKTTQTIVEFMADSRAPFYQFSYRAFQKNEQKTLSEFPAFVKWQQEATVLKYEKDNNGIFVAEKSELNYKSKGITKDKRYYKVENGKDTAVSRIHWIYKTGYPLGLAQTVYYFQDYTLAFYGGLDGVYRLTKEFKDLAKKNGYAYAKFYKGRYYFYKDGDKKKGTMVVARYKDKDLGYILYIAMY